MENAEREEIDERIRIAREFKRRTCGSVEIDDAVFTDMTWRPNPKPVPKGMTRAEKRRRAREYRVSYQIQIAKEAQIEHGGTYGVTMSQFQGKRKRYMAHLGKGCRVFLCAISAAEARNAVMAKLYPGQDSMQVDLNAAWKKWGCSCGKHKKG